MWTEAEIRRVIMTAHLTSGGPVSIWARPGSEFGDGLAHDPGSLPRARHNGPVPEGDTVWRACQRLNEVLAGRVLTRSEFRVPSLAATDLTGIGVRQVISRGKHQLFRLQQRLHAAHPLQNGRRLEDLPSWPALERWTRVRSPRRASHE
jgi:hypothetical protein